jgi:hypothetical protein
MSMEQLGKINYSEELDEALKIGGLMYWESTLEKFDKGELLDRYLEFGAGGVPITREYLERVVAYARWAEHNGINIGDRLLLEKDGEQRWVMVTDFPGDLSMMTVEPHIDDDDDHDPDDEYDDYTMAGVDECDDGYNDSRPVRVGWHLDGWEIKQIVRKENRKEVV